MPLRISRIQRASLLAVSLIALAPLSTTISRADEPRGPLSRLFRFGNRRDHEPQDRAERPKTAREDGGTPGAPPAEAPSPFGVVPASPLGNGALSPYRAGGGNPYGSSPSAVGGYNPLLNPPGNPAPSVPAVSNFTGPSTVAPSSAPTASGRLVPQPRVNRPITEAEPILTRISIGRSDDGQHFGMFLQVFADGTVLDSMGVHHVGPEALRPLVEALRKADVGRLQGHCGGPPTDFIEQVHLTVYDQNRGRLQANHFSFSGNPAGCDPAIRTLQAAIDAFQARLSGPPLTAASPTPPAAHAPGMGAGDSAPTPPLAPPTAPDTTAKPITLTPIN